MRAHIPSDLAFCLSFIRHCKCSLSYWYRCCRNWSSFYHREVLQEGGKAMINCHWCSLYNQDLAGKGALPWLSCPSVTDKFVCNDQVYLTKICYFAPSVGSFISATTTKKWHYSRILSIRMIACNILPLVGMCLCVHVRGSRCYGWLLALVIEWKFGKEVLDCINKQVIRIHILIWQILLSLFLTMC